MTDPGDSVRGRGVGGRGYRGRGQGRGGRPEVCGTIVGVPFRVAFLDDYQDVALSLTDLPDGVDAVSFADHVADPARLTARLRGIDAVVCMRERTPITAQILDGLPDLQLLITTGMRNASIDVAAARARGISVCGRSGAGRASTTEHTWALVLALARNLRAQDTAIRAGGWQRGLGTVLAGSTLGLIRLGNLGAAMVPVARALGMEVTAWSPNLTAQRAAEVGVEAPGRNAFFAGADVLSVHPVLSECSVATIGAREFAPMKPGALLVNTLRGAIADEAALLEALRGPDRRCRAGRLRHRAAAPRPLAAHGPAHRAGPARRLRVLVVLPRVPRRHHRGRRRVPQRPPRARARLRPRPAPGAGPYPRMAR